LHYTNKDNKDIKNIFILSSNGCMGTEPDGLESIVVGNEEGARGCCVSVDLTADGIAVLSETGYCVAADGTQWHISDYSYAELHQAAPQLISVGQALDLAKTCQSKIVLTVRNETILPQLRLVLRHANYFDHAIFVFVGLGLVEAARIAAANPDLHIMGEMPTLPDDIDAIDALVRAAQTTGLFGIRTASSNLVPPLIAACRQAGLFTMSLPTDDEAILDSLVERGVNFIETSRPDFVTMLVPESDPESHQIPILRY